MDIWSDAQQQGHMQAPNSTILLVWGLFDNKRCTAQPLAVQCHRTNQAIPESGWNLPASLLEVAGTTPVKQLVLGWSYALWLTEQGECFVAQASQVLQQARNPLGSSALQLPPLLSTGPDQSSSSSSSSSRVWQAVQLAAADRSMRQVVPAATPIKQVAAGDHHCLLLDHSGCVWTMGSNQHGQLGLPPQQAAAAASGAADKALETAADSQQALHTGCFVAVLGPASGSEMQEIVQQVAAGSCHSIAVTAVMGRVYAWGWNAHGQCGTGSTVDVHQPTLCTALDGVPIASAAAGMAHTVAASRDGAVYAWGCGSDGQLGLPGPAAAVDSNKGVADGQATYGGGDASSGSGSAWQQQQQQQQQLQSSSSLLPVLVEHEELDHEDVVQVACGSRHTAVLTASGRVFCWGLNKHGQCCTAAAAEASSDTVAAAAAARTAMAASQDSSQVAMFDVQRIAAPRAVMLPEAISMASSVQNQTRLRGSQGKHTATEGKPPSPHSARKLVECGKAVALRAGRWHTIIEVNCG